MRKLLAVLLAAIMLVGVLAALPASAESTGASKFDGTTSAETPTLLITEVLVNSKTGNAQLDDQVKEGEVAEWFSPDAFDYIEIYNAGDTAVSLYDYTIARANGSNFFSKAEDATGVALYTDHMQLCEYAITGHPDASGIKYGTYDAPVNPAESEVVLAPGEFALIWFYGEDTTTYADLTKPDGGVTISHFKEHYDMPEDTLVIAVPGKASNGTSFALEAGYTYALVHDSFDFSMGAVSSPWGDDPELNENGSLVMCMADYILKNAVGIYSTVNMDDMAACYVPASCKPDVLNQVNQQTAAEGETPVQYNDYVEADYTKSYRSTAILSYVEEPTPGAMPAWQWAYVDPVGGTSNDGVHGLAAVSAATADAEYEATMSALVSDWETNTAIKADGKLAENWSTACINALKTAKADVITGEGTNTEVKIDYSKNFVSRDELSKRHGIGEKGQNEEEGLPTWVLILIIVGGVVLVAGIAVVVIIIIKKKNKPVAADDVAAEGEIQIVDETAANEAPVDENKE